MIFSGTAGLSSPAPGQSRARRGAPPGRSVSRGRLFGHNKASEAKCKGGGNDGGGTDGGAYAFEPSLFVAYSGSASDVNTIQFLNNNSTTRVDGLRPTDTSKALRIIKLEASFAGATANGLELYFGTGANISTNPRKEVTEFRRAAIGLEPEKYWGCYQGPVGLPGEVLSYRGTDAVAQDVRVKVTYREE